MKREFDEERTIRALDRLFKENEELKVRLANLEKQVNFIYDMIGDIKNNEKREFSN